MYRKDCDNMAETMKAGVLAGPQKIVVQDVPVPELKPGELEIEVKACGVCGSDIHMWKTGKGGVAEQDGLTADGKWVFLVRLRRGKLDKLLVHQIVKGNLPFPLPFKLQNLVQGGTADNSLAKGVVPALDIFLIGYLVGHGNSPF